MCCRSPFVCSFNCSLSLFAHINSQNTCRLVWILCSTTLGLKGSPLQVLSAAALLMAFLMVADRCRSHWHWALECSALLINHNQSCAITSIFLVNYCEGQLVQLCTTKLVVFRHKRNIWSCKRDEREKPRSLHLDTCRRCRECFSSNATSAPIDLHTATWLLPSCEIEIH